MTNYRHLQGTQLAKYLHGNLARKMNKNLYQYIEDLLIAEATKEGVKIPTNFDESGKPIFEKVS